MEKMFTDFSHGMWHERDKASMCMCCCQWQVGTSISTLPSVQLASWEATDMLLSCLKNVLQMHVKAKPPLQIGSSSHSGSMCQVRVSQKTVTQQMAIHSQIIGSIFDRALTDRLFEAIEVIYTIHSNQDGLIASIQLVYDVQDPSDFTQ